MALTWTSARMAITTVTANTVVMESMPTAKSTATDMGTGKGNRLIVPFIFVF